MKLLVLAGLLAASAMTALQASPATDNTDQRSPTNYDPQIPTTSDRPAPTNVGDSPQVEGYTDHNRYSRTDQGEYFSGNPMRVAGRVVKDSNRFVNRKLQISADGQRWTISAPDDVFSLGQNGERLSIHDLREGDWVVAEGNQTGDMRIRALAIRKLGDDFSDYQRSAFFQPKHPGGFAMNITAGPDFRMQARQSIMGVQSQVAGTMDTYRNSRTSQREYFSGNPMRVAGRVVKDSNRFVNRKLHVDVNGQRWSINAPDDVFSLGQNGERLSIHEIHDGDWVVAEGNQVGDMRIRALAIRKLGDDFSDYQRSIYFQPKHPGGFAMNITAGPDFRMQARESIMGIQSQVAGERQETGGSPKK